MRFTENLGEVDSYGPILRWAKYDVFRNWIEEIPIYMNYVSRGKCGKRYGILLVIGRVSREAAVIHV